MAFSILNLAYCLTPIPLCHFSILSRSLLKTSTLSHIVTPWSTGQLANCVAPSQPSVSHLHGEQQWSCTAMSSLNPLVPQSSPLLHLSGQHCRTSTANNNNPFILCTSPTNIVNLLHCQSRSHIFSHFTLIG